VTCALHDRLRARELYVATEAFRHRKVRTADQEKPKLGCAQLLLELRVAASRDVHLKGVRRLLEHLVIESVFRRVHIER
jgi:hypothetical protein